MKLFRFYFTQSTSNISYKSYCIDVAISGSGDNDDADDDDDDENDCVMMAW